MQRRRKTTKTSKSLLDLVFNEDWKFSLVASGFIFIMAGTAPFFLQGTVFSIAAMILQKFGVLIGFLLLGISVVWYGLMMLDTLYITNNLVY